MILPHFRTSMNDFIKSKLTTKVRDAKEKQASKKIEDFKNKSLKDKRLPIEIINNTATMSGCSPTVLRDYLDKNLPKILITSQRLYVVEKNAGARSDNQPKEQSPAENVSQSVEESRIRSTSINKIIRSNLPTDIRSMLMKNLQETMDKTSNYIANFCEIVFLTILLLKDGSLVCKDNKTNYDRSTKDLDLSKILPKEFVSTTQILGPAPLPICL
ncbi:hypothetical protein EDC94DRAFT_676426 [Helicostylum pulchrum]|nr:hypothetical protein EDC94DRAFT_676426 [Helicostylum pulchrum]